MLVPLFSIGGGRVMEAGTYMPAIEGVTTGMTRENCMAYCHNKKKPYKYFGKNTNYRGEL